MILIGHGWFFVINKKQDQHFCDIYLKEFDIQNIKISSKSGKRLSWQYYYRRAEISQVLRGNVGVITSDNNEEGVVQILEAGNKIELKQGVRHRLIGMKDWGILAEVWRHKDSEIPSDEEDIVRVQDDYGR